MKRHLLLFLLSFFLFSSNIHAQVAVNAVTASSSQSSNTPDKTLDNDLSTRWASNGSGEWIKYDLGSIFNLSSVDLAFYRGNLGIYYFSIEVSEDNVNYTSVYQGESSGSSNNPETFNFSGTNARYVKIIGQGNNTSTAPNYNAITETVIYGSAIGNQPPQAALTVDEDAGHAPFTVTFDASGSSDADGNTLSYNWDFGDGNSGTGQTISHIYQEGYYEATLMVSDGNGTNTATKKILAYGAEGFKATGLSLINADTDQEIKLISDGETLNLSALPTRNINFKANVSPSRVGSIVFDVNGQNSFRSDNDIPYSLAGAHNGNYFNYTPSPATYAVTIRPFVDVDGTGTAGTPATINFTIIDQPNTAPVLAAIGDQTVTEGEQLTLALSATDTDNDPLTFSLSTVADFINLRDNGDGTAVLSITPSYQIAGTYSATVTVDDGNGESASETFTITVISNPGGVPQAGDFRTKASGDWGDYSIWQKYNATTHDFVDVSIGELPGTATNVYIQKDHAVTMSGDGSCKSLNLNGTLDVRRLDVGDHVLEVWGQLRFFSGAIPGTNQNLGGITAPPGQWIHSNENSGGRIRFRGSTDHQIIPGTSGGLTDGLSGWADWSLHWIRE